VTIWVSGPMAKDQHSIDCPWAYFGAWLRLARAGFGSCWAGSDPGLRLARLVFLWAGLVAGLLWCAFGLLWVRFGFGLVCLGLAGDTGK
jgi:hypothetical protein